MSFKRPIFVCGFMGAGKTTFVKKLSLASLDLDDLILKENKKDSIKTLIEEKGWSFFRREEERVILKLLEEDHFYLLALGGGSLSSGLIEKIKNKVTLIWLSTPFELCLKRVLPSKQERPLLSLSKEELQKLYEERLPLYQQAHLTIGPEEAEKISSLELLQDHIKN